MAIRILVVAPRFDGSPLTSRFLAGSLAGHVLFLVTVLLLPSLRARNSMPDAPLIVDLVPLAAPVRAPATAPAKPPVPAVPTPPPEGVRVESKLPEPAKLDPPPEKKPQPEKKPPPEPDVRPQAPAPAAAQPASAEPAPGEPGGMAPEVGASITALEGVGDVEFGWYKASVTAALYGNWRKPILEGIGEPTEVRVTFEIQRNGQVSDLRLATSSGVPSLDRSALRAVTDAAPLPPLPANWDGPTLSAGFVFRLYPD